MNWFTRFALAAFQFVPIACNSVRPDPWTLAHVVSEAKSPAANDEVQRGREVFLQGTCSMCHTIRGTRALGTVGPDLTHLASRRTLAAGTLPNTRGHLAGWILNPQNLKPGTRMPPTGLSPLDFHALVAFLETLD